MWWRTAAAQQWSPLYRIWLFYSVESPEIEVAGITGTRNIKKQKIPRICRIPSPDSIQEEKDRSICNEGDGDGSTGFDSTKQEDWNLEPIQMHRAGEAGFTEQTAPDYAISTRKLFQRNFIPFNQ